MRMIPFILLLSLSVARAAELSIIPRPNEIEMGQGVFMLDDRTAIVAEGKQAAGVAAYLNGELKKSRGIAFRIRKAAGTNCIVFSTSGAPGSLGDEGYTLLVDSRRITITARGGAGLFYGVQTLRQLLPPENLSRTPVTGVKWTVPAVKITDRPRFTWRGMHLDVCRHFFNKAFIRKYLDIMAFHKMNTFHWHLTEDQGWRIEIKKYPRLTETGAWRSKPGFGFPTEDSDPDCFNAKGQYGGFYTQEDVKEIVAYAAARHITIVPEIEMPGHSKAALKAYPHLACTDGPFEIPLSGGVYEDVYCAGNDRTMQFLEDVLAEVVELFPGEFVHVGGDECPKKRWKACAKCQKRIKDEKLHDEHELQSYVIRRASKFLASKGKRLIGWNEIMEGGLAEGAAIMSWTGEGPGIKAAKMGHDSVMTPGHYCYFDHYQAKRDEPRCFGDFLPLKRVYSYNPMPKELTTEEERKHILGSQGNMWSECYENRRKAEYMLEPRASALCEVLWSKQTQRDWSSFQSRMLTQYARLQIMDVNYRTPRVSITEEPLGTVVISSDVPGAPILYTLDGSEPNLTSSRYAEPITSTRRDILSARLLMPGGRLGGTSRTKLNLPRLTFDTSISFNPVRTNPPEFAGDGFMESFFWSNTNIKAGDHFTATLETAKRFKMIRAYTGAIGYERDCVHKGILEVAYVGGEFKTVATFDGNRVAAARLDGVVKAVRIKVTASQANWLIISEITLDQSTGQLSETVAQKTPAENKLPAPNSTPFTYETTISYNPNRQHPPELTGDGSMEKFFWGDTNTKIGDTFTATLKTPKRFRTIRVYTGAPTYTNDRLHKGVLEVAYEDGEFKTLAEFGEDGIATAKLDGVVKAVRIRATAAQPNWLIIREIVLE